MNPKFKQLEEFIRNSDLKFEKTHFYPFSIDLYGHGCHIMIEDDFTMQIETGKVSGDKLREIVGNIYDTLTILEPYLIPQSIDFITSL